MARSRVVGSPVTELATSIASSKSRIGDLENVAHRHPGFISGIIRCTSTTRPTAEEGLVIYETDTDRFYFYDGSGWRYWGGVFAYTNAERLALPTTDGLTIWTTDTNRLWVYDGAAWRQVWPPLQTDMPTIGARLRMNAAQNCANAAFNIITWDAVDYNTGGAVTFAAGGNTATIAVAGTYLLQLSVGYAANGVGLRFAGLNNGPGWYTYQFGPNATALFGQIVVVSTVVNLAVGNAVQGYGWQNSGGVLAFGVGAFPFGSHMTITYLGS